MVMLRCVADLESDSYFLIKAIDFLPCEIRTYFKRKTVDRGFQGLAVWNHIAGSTVPVRPLASYWLPASNCSLPIKSHQDPGCGHADRNIQNMGRYSAHSDKSFLRRISVILCCSRPAFMISVLRSLP